MGLEMTVNPALSVPPPGVLGSKPVPDAAGTLAKGEFGRFIGVSPGRVSQYIAAGKIDGAAITKDGRIVVALAQEQLRNRLDASQMAGNGLDTKLKAEIPATLAPESAPASSPAPLPLLDTVEDQIKRARLEGIAYDNRKKAEDEAARAGRYTETEAVKQQLGRLAGQMIAEFDGMLADFATDLAATFKIPQRDALHRLRTRFRDSRAAASALLASRAAEMPALVEDQKAEDAATGS